MSTNKLFSVQSNGYDINEVDDYVTFIQSELTKNMKLNRDIEVQKNNLNEKINSLEKEIDTLNKKNSKLYKDCVAFAKRLKSLEVYDIIPTGNINVNNISNDKISSANEDEAASENDNRNGTKDIVDESLKQLTAEYEDLKKELNLSFSQMDNLKNENLKLHKENSELKDSLQINKIDDIITTDNTVQDDIEEKEIEKNNNDKVKNKIKSKNNFFSSFINFITIFFIVITVCVIFISSFTYIFIKVPDLSFFNHRTFTVQTATMQPAYSLNDVVITKKQNVDSIKTGSYVIIKNPYNYGNIIQRVTDINKKNNIYTFELKDNSDNKSYFSVSKSKSLYLVNAKIPNIGKIAKFAFNKPLIYIAILLLILLISFLLRLLFLSPKKTKRNKFEADYPDYTLNI